jgi:hypothetical protein
MELQRSAAQYDVLQLRKQSQFSCAKRVRDLSDAACSVV